MTNNEKFLLGAYSTIARWEEQRAAHIQEAQDLEDAITRLKQEIIKIEKEETEKEE